MNDKDMEQWKAENAGRLAQYDAEQSLGRELFKAVILSGQSALKSAILINGGAAVALLAFIGSRFEFLEDKTQKILILVSMIMLIIGVLVAAIASGLTYLAQRHYYYDENNTIRDRINSGIIILVVFSYIFFTLGCLLPIIVFTLAC